MDSAFRPVILFDGVCNLCNAAVLWVIDRDTKGVFRFASLQSEAAREVLQDAGDLPDSVVLVDEDGVHTRSEAAMRIAGKLGFPYRLVAVGRLMPGFLRDAVYRWIAKNRYGWFGRMEACRVPSPELAGRFLDAGERIEVPAAAMPASAAANWFLRFLWAYVLLYAIPTPPSIGHPFYTTLAMKLFSIRITAYPRGSGDTTYNYIETGFEIALAMVIALLWRWRLPQWSFAGIHLLLRYFLATTMLTYGWLKVIPIQFIEPGPAWLMQTYGDSSPMRLLWTMIGASTPYQMFTGAVEVLVGVLLLFPATALIGAIACAAASVQIMALNYCYDVPVKLMSTHLFLFSCVLIAPDLPRIVSFFVLRLPVVAPPIPRLPLPGKWWPRLALGLKCLILVNVLLLSPIGSYRRWKEERAVLAKSQLHGLYSVEAYEAKANEPRWVRVGITGDRVMGVQMSTGELKTLFLRHEEKAKSFEAFERGNAIPQQFRYSKPNPGTLLLEQGTFKLVLKQDAAAQSLLMTRGFHWINEVPFNR